MYLSHRRPTLTGVDSWRSCRRGVTRAAPPFPLAQFLRLNLMTCYRNTLVLQYFTTAIFEYLVLKFIKYFDILITALQYFHFNTSTSILNCIDVFALQYLNTSTLHYFNTSMFHSSAHLVTCSLNTSSLICQSCLNLKYKAYLKFAVDEDEDIFIWAVRLSNLSWLSGLSLDSQVISLATKPNE